ncbi:MAG: polysaccharide pyruvyl transferase family protein, partial [Microcoleaceae cyanobacterium]
IKEFIAGRPMAVIEIDTRLDTNRTGFRSSAEIESVLARMDLVITTRLHGTVLSLKNGVPTISIDVAGDNLKIQKQTGEIGWPVIFVGNELTVEKLNQAFDYCLTAEARAKARECTNRAKDMVLQMRQEFITAVIQSVKSGYTSYPSVGQDINFLIAHNRCDRIGVDLNSNLGWQRNCQAENTSENHGWLSKIKGKLKGIFA